VINLNSPLSNAVRSLRFQLAQWPAARKTSSSIPRSRIVSTEWPERPPRLLRCWARTLSCERPLDLLDTEIGARQVEEVLLRLNYGIFS